RRRVRGDPAVALLLAERIERAGLLAGNKFDLEDRPRRGVRGGTVRRRHRLWLLRVLPANVRLSGAERSKCGVRTALLDRLLGAVRSVAFGLVRRRRPAPALDDRPVPFGQRLIRA